MVLAGRRVAEGVDGLALDVGELPFPEPPRLLDRLRRACRVRQLSPRTEDCYAAWAERFIRFHGLRHPNTMGAPEIDRRVRALQPWPGATLPSNRGRVKVLSGHVEGDRYVPDVVQLPGKKPAPAKQVLGDA